MEHNYYDTAGGGIALRMPDSHLQISSLGNQLGKDERGIEYLR